MGLATLTVRSKKTGGIVKRIMTAAPTPPDHRRVRFSLLESGFDPDKYQVESSYDATVNQFETLIDIFGELNLETGEFPHLWTLHSTDDHPLSDLEVRHLIALNGYDLQSVDYWAVSIPLGVPNDCPF